MPNVIILPHSAELFSQDAVQAAFEAAGKTFQVVGDIGELTSAAIRKPRPDFVICDGGWLSSQGRAMRMAVDLRQASRVLGGPELSVSPASLVGLTTSDKLDVLKGTPVIGIWSYGADDLRRQTRLNVIGTMDVPDVYKAAAFTQVVNAFYAAKNAAKDGLVTPEAFEAALSAQPDGDAAHTGAVGSRGRRRTAAARQQASR